MIFFRWLINALSLIVVSLLVPGVTVHSLWAALIAALVIGLVNALLRPVLLVLTLPITMVTIGLFSLILNALLFWLVSTMVKGFDVASFSAAFWGATVLWLISWSTSTLLKGER